MRSGVEPYDREDIATLLDRERLLVTMALMAYGDFTIAADKLQVDRADLVDAVRRWNARPLFCQWREAA